MMDGKILPAPGRWQREAMAVGVGRLTQGCEARHAPTTTLRAVPLPVPGRI